MTKGLFLPHLSAPFRLTSPHPPRNISIFLVVLRRFHLKKSLEICESSFLDDLYMNDIQPLRTRFAPSPTGQLHLGGARTALFSYLLAKKTGGSFIVRIEDTDQERYVENSEDGIFEGLEWLGMVPDESPRHDGAFGPYRQSERLSLYEKYAQELLEKGAAYYCFCSSEELKHMREEQIAKKQAPKYDGRCRNLSHEEVEKKLQTAQVKPVIRMKIPETGVTTFRDLIHGKVAFQNKDLDDQVLLKSDGYPTYHLAVVVDDHLMNITMSVRSEEWLPSTPKHVLLYKAFGWPMPETAHLPLVLNKNHAKMSKRKDGDAVWISTYKEKGYLPEAVVNYLAFLGWNPKTTQEVFSLQELIDVFDLKNVHKAGAVFDIDRLDYVNSLYIRKLSATDLATKALPFLRKKDFVTVLHNAMHTQSGREISQELLTRVVGLEQERMKHLDEVGESTRFFFLEDVDVAAQDLIWKKSDKTKTHQALFDVYKILESLEEKDFAQKNLEQLLFDYIQKNGWGNGDVLWPLRMCLTGQKASPSPFECLEILGKHLSLARIQKALAKLT